MSSGTRSRTTPLDLGCRLRWHMKATAMTLALLRCTVGRLTMKAPALDLTPRSLHLQATNLGVTLLRLPIHDQHPLAIIPNQGLLPTTSTCPFEPAVQWVVLLVEVDNHPMTSSNRPFETSSPLQISTRSQKRTSASNLKSGLDVTLFPERRLSMRL